MPDVGSTAPEQVRGGWRSICTSSRSWPLRWPPHGGAPEFHQIETTEAPIRRFIARLGGPADLAVC
jgi:hypothetical protein